MVKCLAAGLIQPAKVDLKGVLKSWGSEGSPGTGSVHGGGVWGEQRGVGAAALHPTHLSCWGNWDQRLCLLAGIRTWEMPQTPKGDFVVPLPWLPGDQECFQVPSR